jgi:hypothetical protein
MMVDLPYGGGLRYNDNATGSVPGAQTERRGLAGPVRDLLGGETSPAAFSSKDTPDNRKPEDY